MLQGKRILLVEDEAIIAMMLEDMVVKLEGIAIGPATNVQSGMDMARMEDFDAAVLDVNLGDGTSIEIADLLTERHIPFILATGYDATTQNTHKAPILQKPYMMRDLELALSQIFCRIKTN
ncbi:response regulator [Sphingorhabdus sp.]|uniref:response regulator n=1 Tax=Sphingorhabdus sp. TaxID=1902408 RepID=UPI00391C6A2A